MLIKQKKQYLYSDQIELVSRLFPEPRSCRYGNDEGWKCDDGECIPQRWVCDQINQCPFRKNNAPDNSDEEIGCNLYPGNIGDLSIICPFFSILYQKY